MIEPIVLEKYHMFEDETARQRILNVLLLSPNEEFSLTDLAALSGVSKSSASRVIGGLKQEGVVQVKEDRIIWRIKANTGSRAFMREKIPFNLTVIYRSRLVDFLIQRFNAPKAIVLFGSFRKGEDIASSDIDLAVETIEPRELQILRLNELKEFEARIKRQVRVHVFNRKAVDLNLFNSIANGIVLFGFLEVRP